MSLCFIISLATCLVAAYIFKNSVEEIAYPAGAISLVGLLLSLVSAPWFLQVLLLILVWLIYRRYSLSSECVAEPRSEEKTKLHYRGVKYEPTSVTGEVTEAEITGKYRGQVWKSRNLTPTK